MTPKQIFGNFKHMLPIHRSNKYIKYLKSIHPNKEPHHLLGSQGKLKLTDYLIVMVTREEHLKAEQHKIEFFYNHLAEALSNLFRYISFLESH